MKLAELLNVDTTKENWFKLLSKKGITPKTVNSVSKGGGGGDGIKEYYYKVLNTLGDTLPVFINPSEIIVPIDQEIYVKATAIVGVQDTGSFSYYPLYFYLIEDLAIAFKILDREEHINVGSQNVTLPKGNLHTRLAALGEDLEPLDSVIQEITKEEYESLITQ